MVEDSVQEKVGALIQRYGIEIVSEPKRLEALLRDYCPNNKRETHILITAVQAQIPAEILSSSMPGQLLHGRLIARLRDDLAMAEEAAQWAVQTWERALLPPEPGNTDQPGATAEPAPEPVHDPSHLHKPTPTGMNTPTSVKQSEIVEHPLSSNAAANSGQTEDTPANLPPASIQKAKQNANAGIVIGDTLETSDPSIYPPMGKSMDILKSRYGIEMTLIPAGAFEMGDDDQSDNPRHTVTLSSYYMSKNVITVKQYLEFCTAVAPARSWLQNQVSVVKQFLEFPGITGPPPAPDFNPHWRHEDYPIVNLSWEDAKAYCAWLSQKTGLAVTLPTEAQWEKAARGTDGRKFPWGDTFDGSKLRCSKHKQGDAGGACAVGVYNDSPYGLSDMAGNVFQWCVDWYDKDYWKSDHGAEPTGPTIGTLRVVRSGSWGSNTENYFHCSYRDFYSPVKRKIDLGFRIVISVQA